MYDEQYCSEMILAVAHSLIVVAASAEAFAPFIQHISQDEERLLCSLVLTR